MNLLKLAARLWKPVLKMVKGNWAVFPFTMILLAVSGVEATRFTFGFALPFATAASTSEIGEITFILTILFFGTLFSTMASWRIIIVPVFLMVVTVSYLSVATGSGLVSTAEWWGIVDLFSRIPGVGASSVRFIAALALGLLIGGLGMAIGTITRSSRGLEVS